MPDVETTAGRAQGPLAQNDGAQGGGRPDGQLIAAPVVRLVATDLDGTLLSPTGELTPRAVEAVQRAREAGLYVVPVTGRPPRFTWDIAQQAGLGPLGVCSNGAVVVDLETSSLLEVAPIAPEVALHVVTTLRKAFPGIAFAAEDLSYFAWEPGFTAGATWRSLDEATVGEVDDIMSVIGPSTTKLVARRPGWPASALLAALGAELAGSANATSSGLDWVEISAPGVSKAYGTERVCQMLEVDASDVLAIGDNHNDLSILAWSGYTAAPANAVAEVLDMVEHVLPTNADDGVAVMLEALCRHR
ncbi:MAG: HAD family hydrolase [Acidimicrobiales bacterium]